MQQKEYYSIDIIEVPSQQNQSKNDKNTSTKSSTENDKLIKKVNKKKRPTNNIIPNIIRSTNTIIKNFFASKKSTLRQVQQFVKSTKINCQIWGFDAIIIFLLHLKSITNKISSTDFAAILILIDSILVKKLNRVQDIKSKQIITKFQEHLQFYKTQQQNRYHDLSVRNNRSQFYNFLVKRKNIQRQRALKRISQIQKFLINSENGCEKKVYPKYFQQGE